MNTTIDCKVCQERIKKDYRIAPLVTIKSTVYYSFRCFNCGQEYLEKPESPIILDKKKPLEAKGKKN